MRSGIGNATDSGAVSIFTPESGVAGVSGGISLNTGYSNAGDSGDILAVIGNTVTGRGGDIRMSVGDGSVGHGGDIFMLAGRTFDENGNGGTIVMEAGNAANTDGSSQGGGFMLSGGDALANVVANCDMATFDCSGMMVNASVYYALTRGCERICSNGDYTCNGKTAAT